MARSARLIGLAMLVGGGVLLVWSIYAAMVSMPTYNWTVARGMVYSSEATATFGDEAGFHSISVDYRYRAPDSQRGFRVYAADIPLLSEGHARQLISDYPAGAVIDVFYDPQDPSRSVLVQGLPPALLHLFIPSLVLQTLGASMLMRARMRTSQAH